MASRIQWLPKRADAPGIALAGVLGTAALALTRSLPSKPWLSDILVSLLLGIAVLNTPLRRLVGLELPGDDREPDRYAKGFRYTGKWLLRLGVILMGLEVQTSFFGSREMLLIIGVITVTIPSAFLIAHSLAAVAGVRRPFADLLGVGTMICGASAINASAPVVRARRSEQGIAIGVVFLFSIFALLTYQPVVLALDLPPRMGGIWAGLAVNDLSSAVAVGKQMGDEAALMAAAAKSARILMLGPALIAFAFLRRRGARTSVRAGVLASLPRFILGYIALAFVRTAVDRWVGSSPTWNLVLWLDGAIVDLLLCTVAAGIGLHLGIEQLLRSGGRAIAVGGGTSLWMAGLSLSIVTATSRDAPTIAVVIGIVGLTSSALAAWLARRGDQYTRSLQARLDAGDWLSLDEAAELLSASELGGRFDEALCRKVMTQLQPAIGELIPVRQGAFADGQVCRVTAYWQGDNGWTLGAVVRAPGSVTEVHAHPELRISKAIEGDIDEVRLAVEHDTVVVTSVTRLSHNVVTTTDRETPHVIVVPPGQAAFELQLRGPTSGVEPMRLPTSPLEPDVLTPGTRIPIVNDAASANRS